MRVRHFGNTANNAFYNTRLLERYAGIESVLPIHMFGLRHAISAPAWEVVDFDVPSAEWVPEPDWSPFPEAVAVNAEYTDLPAPSAAGDPGVPPTRSPRARLVTAAGRAIAPLRGSRWAQPVFDHRERQILAGSAVLSEAADEINILYGADSLGSFRLPDPSAHTVCLEHGTIRWIADGSREQSVRRKAYREQVQNAAHLWVTNLDPRTLEVAEDIVPGRWSALPHPTVFDPRVPLAESPTRRKELLESTGSEYLVLLPASQNWSRYHDKGSMKALSAFVELRRTGVDVGLVAVEWGLQVAEARAFLERSGVDQHVVWVPPMARLSLQGMMANVDVVWDQFGMQVFGAVALRTLEQGTPLLSQGLAPVGEQLIGAQVPWLRAGTTDEIVYETGNLFEDLGRRGREAVMGSARAHYRAWLLRQHSPTVGAVLQRDVYRQVLDGARGPGLAAPDQWAREVR